MNGIVVGVLGRALSGLFWAVFLRGPEDRASSTSVGLNFPHSASCFYFVERRASRQQQSYICEDSQRKSSFEFCLARLKDCEDRESGSLSCGRDYIIPMSFKDATLLPAEAQRRHDDQDLDY
jgi:hypothetical protein